MKIIKLEKIDKRPSLSLPHKLCILLPEFSDDSPLLTPENEDTPMAEESGNSVYLLIAHSLIRWWCIFLGLYKNRFCRVLYIVILLIGWCALLIISLFQDFNPSTISTSKAIMFLMMIQRVLIFIPLSFVTIRMEDNGMLSIAALHLLSQKSQRKAIRIIKDCFWYLICAWVIGLSVRGVFDFYFRRQFIALRKQPGKSWLWIWMSFLCSSSSSFFFLATNCLIRMSCKFQLLHYKEFHQVWKKDSVDFRGFMNGHTGVLAKLKKINHLFSMFLFVQIILFTVGLVYSLLMIKYKKPDRIRYIAYSSDVLFYCCLELLAAFMWILPAIDICKREKTLLAHVTHFGVRNMRYFDSAGDVQLSDEDAFRIAMFSENREILVDLHAIIDYLEQHKGALKIFRFTLNQALVEAILFLN